MATARIEHWPGGPEGRAYTADGRVNAPPGWKPPAPEHQERIGRLVRERQAEQRSAENTRDVREKLAARFPGLARSLDAAARDGDACVRECPPRERQGRGSR